MEQKSIFDFDKELSDAYSYDRYKNGWVPSIKMLRKENYNDREIEALLRSKWARRAANNSVKSYGNVTASDLKKYIELHITRKDIIQLALERSKEQ